MSITTTSTGLDDQNRARRLPPDLLHRTNELLDECDELKAEVKRLQALEAAQHDPGELERLRAQVQRLKPDDAHARQCRTDAIEKLVLLALDNDTLRVDLLDMSRCRRTKKVREHLRDYKDRYGIKKPPTHASVKKVLVKHGYV